MSALVTPRIAILASRNGSTAEAFIMATQDGRVDAEVGLVVCNNPMGTVGIYDRIARLNHDHGLRIPILHISGITHPLGKGEKGEQTFEESEQICIELDRADCDMVLLAGYFKRVRGDLLIEHGYYPGMASPYYASMLNSHPAPKEETRGLFGIKAQERVIDLGIDSAHVVHVVSNDYDAGPTIWETTVPRLQGDTPESLTARVQAVEKLELPIAVNNFLKLKRAA